MKEAPVWMCLLGSLVAIVALTGVSFIVAICVMWICDKLNINGTSWGD